MKKKILSTIIFGLALFCVAVAGPFQYCVWWDVRTKTDDATCTPGKAPLECGECSTLSYQNTTCHFNVYTNCDITDNQPIPATKHVYGCGWSALKGCFCDDSNFIRNEGVVYLLTNATGGAASTPAHWVFRII